MPSQPGLVLGTVGARQLLRRATFAATPDAVADFAPLTRQQAADQLADYTPAKFRPNHKYIEVAHGKWIKYMLRTKLQLQEKMVLFLHDHFATGNDKVVYPQAMSLQNRTLRTHSNGNFKDLVKAINVDPAMIEFLDTQRNRRYEPNENYARELQELFTLGVFDLNGKANYKQADIVQIARAFTGWRYDYNKLTPYFNNTDVEGGGGQHDYAINYPSRGAKEIYGTARDDGPGNVGGFVLPQSFAPTAAIDNDNLGNEGAPEIDAVIDIIFAHKDSEGQSTVARFLTKKLLSYFCYDSPSKTLIDEVISDSDFATDAHPNQWNLGALLKAIFINDACYETSAEPPYAGSEKKSIKWPVDYVVGTLRLLNMKLRSRYPYIVDGDGDIYDVLSGMGQILFDPPSVFGWDWETSWVSSTTLLSRFSFARDVIHARYGSGRVIFQPGKLMDLNTLSAGVSPNGGDIVDAVLDVLGMTDLFTTNPAWPGVGELPGERESLIIYLTDDDPNAHLDLNDTNTRNVKLHGLFDVVLQSAQYQLH